MSALSAVWRAIARPGKERWAIKTGTDPEAASITLTPVLATVGELRVLPPPRNPNTLTSRDAPVETTVYQVTATLTQAHLEADSDYHLVIADGLLTIIAEIPDPGLITASPWLPQIRAARQAFEAVYGKPEAWIHPNCRVTVVGVGFFDHIHGQAGVAPNGIELHPVLSFVIT